jgi:hypothetical protein
MFNGNDLDNFMMNTPLLKIYGERNTGTNYLAKLIRENLDVIQLPGVPPRPANLLIRKFPKLPIHEPYQDYYFQRTFAKNLGWKHALVWSVAELKKLKICENNICFITISKNPYSWLLSLYKRPYHYYQSWEAKPDFETFLTSPSPTVRRENAPDIFSSPIDLWNQKNASYIQLKSGFPTLNLKYEDLILSPEETIELISQEFSLNAKLPDFKNREKSTKEKDKDFSFYREYYLEEKWREKISQNAIMLISEGLDDNVMQYFGYEKLA